jgi:hypothetical protein
MKMKKKTGEISRKIDNRSGLSRILMEELEDIHTG